MTTCLYGTRTAGNTGRTAQMFAHVKCLPTLPTLKSRASCDDTVAYIHLVSRSLCCQVRCMVRAVLYGGATVCRTLVSVFTCQSLISLSRWRPPNLYCNVHVSPAPRRPHSPSRRSSSITHTKKAENATRDSGSVLYRFQQLLKSPFLLCSYSENVE